MHLPDSVVKSIWGRLEPIIQRVPDEIIGHQHRWRAREPNGYPVARPFLLRWFIEGRKRPSGCNAYLHQFIRNDEDRALHDHPWCNVSVVLGGQYVEHTIDKGGVHQHELFSAGAVKFRSAKAAHRVELTGDWLGCGQCPMRAPNLPNWVEYDANKMPSWSLFVTGPVQRPWGFHCPKDGWLQSKEFSERGGCE